MIGAGQRLVRFGRIRAERRTCDGAAAAVGIRISGIGDLQRRLIGQKRREERDVRQDVIVEDAVAASDRRLPGSEWIPRHAGARREISLLQIEPLHVPEVVSQAHIQRDVARQVPCILRERREAGRDHTELRIARVPDERNRIRGEIRGVERPIGREREHTRIVLVDVAVEHQAVDVEANLDAMAIALVRQVVDRLDAILDERLRRVRQLSRGRRRTHDRDHVRMLRDQLDRRVRDLDAQLVERAVRQNRRQAADVRQIFVELLRARLLERDSADADVVLRRPIQAEAGLEAIALVDLVRRLGQQLIVVERPLDVAGRGGRRDGGDRHAARALVGDEVVRAVALNRTAEPAAALLLLERRARG